MGELWEAPSISIDEARAIGVPEQTIQDALMDSDRAVYGTSFKKYDPETGVWMRVDPLDVSEQDQKGQIDRTPPQD